MNLMRHEAYNMLVDEALSGLHTWPRGIETYEIPHPISFMSQCDVTVLRRRMNMRLAVVESLMLVAGIFSLDAIKAVAPHADLELYKAQSDYGPRTKDQMQGVLNLLIQDPDTRRAVIYFNTDRHFGSGDLACTTSIQWLVRDNYMTACVSVRSWDLAYGLPMDVMMYGMLTQALARALGVQATRVHVLVGCAHVYESTKQLAHGVGNIRHTLGPSWTGKTSTWTDVRQCAMNALTRVLTHADDTEDYVIITPTEEVTQYELYSTSLPH